ncbi:MAG: hypothetical protein FWD76_04710 [Firmicutes bacterium]|nr:hypothetical protein [Bacillota bacterium]
MDLLVEILNIGLVVCVGWFGVLFFGACVYAHRNDGFRYHCFEVLKRHKVLCISLLVSAIALMGYGCIVFATVSWSESIHNIMQAILCSYLIFVVSCMGYILLVAFFSWHKKNKKQASELES